MNHLRILLVGVAMAFVAVACGGSGDADTVSSSGPALSEIGSRPTVAGGQLDLGSLEGQDTVLWFWAPW